jgi:hypothetical protein
MDLQEFTAWLERTRQIAEKVAHYGFQEWATDKKRGDASNWEEFIDFVSESFEDISKPTMKKILIQGMHNKSFTLSAKDQNKNFLTNLVIEDHYVPIGLEAFSVKHLLWFAFGHGHHGFTLGPTTGRLLAEMMIGEVPFVDPRPFRAERF